MTEPPALPPSDDLDKRLEQAKHYRYEKLTLQDNHWRDPPPDKVKLALTQETGEAFYILILQQAARLADTYGPVLGVDKRAALSLRSSLFSLGQSIQEKTARTKGHTVVEPEYTAVIRDNPQANRVGAAPFHAILSLDVLNLMFGPEFAQDIADNVLENKQYDAHALWRNVRPVIDTEAEHTTSSPQKPDSIIDATTSHGPVQMQLDLGTGKQ